LREFAREITRRYAGDACPFAEAEKRHMRRGLAVAVLLLVVGGISFQVWANRSKILPDSMSGGYFAGPGAAKSVQGSDSAGLRLDKPLRSPLLVAEVRQAKQHRVVLSWNSSMPAGTSGGDLIVGYNVYRRREAGTVYTQYIRINSDLITDTTYVDASVRSGRFYDYQTTAVNGLGVESGPSNQIRVEVPYP
jgi:hypothetical protein